jgi:hypothetical protein
VFWFGFGQFGQCLLAVLANLTAATDKVAKHVHQVFLSSIFPPSCCLFVALCYDYFVLHGSMVLLLWEEMMQLQVI